MKRDKIDLGKSFMKMTEQEINRLLTNPMLIHKIQDSLLEIKDDSLMAVAIRGGARTNVKECLKMIITQYRDNPPMITRIVGKDILEMIEEYEGITLSDDLENLFN